MAPEKSLIDSSQAPRALAAMLALLLSLVRHPSCCRAGTRAAFARSPPTDPRATRLSDPVSRDLLCQVDSVLVIRRRDNNKLACIGGFVEVGETLEEAVRREVMEETTLSVTSLQMIPRVSSPARGSRPRSMLRCATSGEERSFWRGIATRPWRRDACFPWCEVRA